MPCSSSTIVAPERPPWCFRVEPRLGLSLNASGVRSSTPRCVASYGRWAARGGAYFLVACVLEVSEAYGDDIGGVRSMRSMLGAACPAGGSGARR